MGNKLCTMLEAEVSYKFSSIINRSLRDARYVFNSYKQMAFQKSSFYLPADIFKSIIVKLNIEPLNDITQAYCTSSHRDNVNVFDFICALVAFSRSNWKDKIKFIFYLFDFNGSGGISYDEFVILGGCFIRGV